MSDEGYNSDNAVFDDNSSFSWKAEKIFPKQGMEKDLEVFLYPKLFSIILEKDWKQW